MTARLMRKLLTPWPPSAPMSGMAMAQQMKVTIAIGGEACLRYLPTVLAKQLGQYEKAGVNAEMVDFKGGSQALTAVLGGSADVVSGYFDHCVNLAAKTSTCSLSLSMTAIPARAVVCAEADRHDQDDQGPGRQADRGQRTGFLDRLSCSSSC